MSTVRAFLRWFASHVPAIVLAAALALPALPTRAAVPEPPPPAAPAPPDTSAFLPRWLHLHAALGIGWISAPRFLRERYEAGQEIEAGFEARLRPRLRLRLNGQYAMLPALARVNYQFVTSRDLDGNAVTDTLLFDSLGRGWLGAARTELQWRALPHTWLLLGAGRGYLAAGHRAHHFEDQNETIDIEFPGSSGWAWITSLGASYEFDIFGPTLGAEVRWNRLDRHQDELDTWSIRIGWQGK
jgi:hypothetical protein